MRVATPSPSVVTYLEAARSFGWKEMVRDDRLAGKEDRTEFEGPYYAGRHSYDITRDGKRFVMIQLGEEEASLTELHVVLNWFDELERRVPTK
jgi:hypothetical protein